MENGSLVNDPLRYPHSSARFYISGKQGSFAVKDYREILVQLFEEAENLNTDESSSQPQANAE